MPYLHLRQLVCLRPIHHSNGFSSIFPFCISLLIKFLEDHFDGLRLDLPWFGRGYKIASGHQHCLYKFSMLGNSDVV